MKPDETWVLFKAEASGMRRPLRVVEIAAQSMRGYTPDDIHQEGGTVLRTSAVQSTSGSRWTT